jgi:hypothetical protein
MHNVEVNMGPSGGFGYTIGKKKRFMYVTQHADLLWQILVREIYILMKHFGSKEDMQKAFESIKVAKKPPTQADMEKCKLFTEFTLEKEPIRNWEGLLHHCQCSFINSLEAGYILHSPQQRGFVLLLDFNQGNITFTYTDLQDQMKKLKSATIEEIMTFEDMPTISYTEILSDMKDRFEIYYQDYKKIEEEVIKLNYLKKQAIHQGARNIEEKVDKLLRDMEWEERQLHLKRREFYNRLKRINALEEDMTHEKSTL